MPTRRVHVVIEGLVQGVFFRACTKDEASRIGLTGWVRNRPEGTVETVIEGETSQVAAMIRWLQIGSPQSSVTRVLTTEEQPTDEYSDFSIRS